MAIDGGPRRAHVFLLSNGDELWVVPADPQKGVQATVDNFGIRVRGDDDPGFEMFASARPSARGGGQLPSVISCRRADVEVRGVGGTVTAANPFGVARTCLECDGRMCCVEGGALRVGEAGPWIADNGET